MKRTAVSSLVAALLWALAATHARAQQAEGNPRDVLVYKDGDRIQGHLVERTETTLVFHADRFGELRVPAADAVVIKADRPAAVTAAPPAQKAAAQAEAVRVSGWERFSPAVLTARLRDYFGPWHGRLAFSTEVVSDISDRSTFAVEAQLKRKWTADEVRLNGRYDYSETNTLAATTTPGVTPTVVTTPTLAVTDMVKADGLWRHDFSKTNFAQYRPTLEWNRAHFRDGVPADYVLLQQEIGAGLTLVKQPTRELRVGLSENLFDVWTTPAPASHDARTSESAFVETELKLPWGLMLSDRGVYYYSFSSQADGWENRVELTKKFSETLSTAIRHEVRRGSPDGTAQDYTRLRLLLGLDF